METQQYFLKIIIYLKRKKLLEAKNAGVYWEKEKERDTSTKNCVDEKQ